MVENRTFNPSDEGSTPSLPTKYNRDLCRENARRKRLFVESLSSDVCEECGCGGPLSFHHRDPNEKRVKISEILTYSDDAIRLELKKCVRLCGACHRRKHGAQHGSLGRYSNHKCRCGLCRSAWNEWSRNYRRSTRSGVAQLVRAVAS